MNNHFWVHHYFFFSQIRKALLDLLISCLLFANKCNVTQLCCDVADQMWSCQYMVNENWGGSYAFFSSVFLCCKCLVWNLGRTLHHSYLLCGVYLKIYTGTEGSGLNFGETPHWFFSTLCPPLCLHLSVRQESTAEWAVQGCPLHNNQEPWARSSHI